MAVLIFIAFLFVVLLYNKFTYLAHKLQHLQFFNIPLSHLKERLIEIPIGQKLVVHCASGYRSSIAASILEQESQFWPIDLIGGYEAWETIWHNNKGS